MTPLARIALTGCFTAPARRRRGLFERVSKLLWRILP